MWNLAPTAHLLAPIELVVMRKPYKKGTPHAPRTISPMGVSLLTQLHITELPAVCRLPKQDDKGGANPRINPQNAMAT